MFFLKFLALGVEFLASVTVCAVDLDMFLHSLPVVESLDRIVDSSCTHCDLVFRVPALVHCLLVFLEVLLGYT